MSDIHHDAHTPDDDGPWEGLEDHHDAHEPVPGHDDIADPGVPSDVVSSLDALTSSLADVFETTPTVDVDVDVAADDQANAALDESDDPWIDPTSPALVAMTHFDAVLETDTADPVDIDADADADAEDHAEGSEPPAGRPGYGELFDEDLADGDDVDVLGVAAVDGGPWIDSAVLGDDEAVAAVHVGGLELADELGVAATTSDGETDAAALTAGLWEVLTDDDDPDAAELARAALLLLGDDEAER